MPVPPEESDTTVFRISLDPAYDKTGPFRNESTCDLDHVPNRYLYAQHLDLSRPHVLKSNVAPVTSFPKPVHIRGGNDVRLERHEP